MDESYAILRFVGRHSGAGLTLLWPVHGWQVVAPRPAHQKLDLFERAVLGLCRAGVRDQQAIATRLIISADLGRLLVNNLLVRGLLEPSGALTPKGDAAMHDHEEPPPEEAVVGTIFSDPFHGRLWTWFHTNELPLVEWEPNDSGYPVLLTGTAGRQHREYPYLVRFPRVAPSAPEPARILTAIRGHRRRFQEGIGGAEAPWIRRIGVVSPRPSRFWVVMRLRLENHAVAEDPFGWGPSSMATGLVEEELDGSEELRKRVRNVLQTDQLVMDFSALQAEAERVVRQRCPGVSDALEQRLVEMYRAWLEATQPTAPADKWQDLVVKAQKALERLLKDGIFGEVSDVLQNVATSEPFNDELLTEVAKGYGFATPLPTNLAKVRRGKVLAAWENGRGTLRPLVLAALLEGRSRADQPLRRAASRDPKLLERFDRVACLRDPAAHDSDVRIPEREARRLPEEVFEMVTLLMDGR